MTIEEIKKQKQLLKQQEELLRLEIQKNKAQRKKEIQKEKKAKAEKRDIAFKKQSTNQIGNLGAMLNFLAKLGEETLGENFTHTLKQESNRVTQFSKDTEQMELQDFISEAENLVSLVNQALEKAKNK